MSSSEIRRQLEAAQAEVRRWQQASVDLSTEVAKARATTASAGRGVMGALLGSKFRSTMRQAAAATNASISREVASRRARIADGKRQAQHVVRTLQAALKEAQAEEREIARERKSSLRIASKSSSEKKGKTLRAKGNLDLLKKLKEVHKLGLLTDDEFEAKRKKLADEL